MSQAPHENIDVTNPATIPVGDHQYPPNSAQNQGSRGPSDFVDGSGHIFSMYLDMATEEDKKMAENWKDDADGILIFTGLFSAAVASLISVSIQDLQQNPQDTSNFYLANMYQATINPNASSSLPASPPPFSPPNYAVWVNGLWFLSLVISITCALLATLLQQWARRYLKVTQPRYSPHRRARIRAFFAEGVDKFLLPWAVEALPTMLHLSLFLFFAGLAVFLWNVNLTIFKLVLSWIGLCTALYGCITFIPVFCHDSPYYTPLSLPVWQFVMGLRFLTFRALALFTTQDCFSYGTYHRFQSMANCYRKLLVQGMRKTAEESAFGSPSEIDTRAFLWTFDSLDEDHELEHFFSGLPGFRSSKVVKDPLPDLTWEQQGMFLNTWIGLLDRTSSSDLLPELVKIRRTVICGKAIGPDIPDASWRVLRRIVSEDQYGPVQSAEIARLVGGWRAGGDSETTMIIQATVSSVIARAQRRDDLWFAMAADEMGVPEPVLRNHAMHANNLSLAVLIHIVRLQFVLLWEQHWPKDEFSKVLKAASRFNVLDTSPELQHEFCALWNQVVHANKLGFPWYILRPIRIIYLMLHRHTNSAPTAFSDSTGDRSDVLLLQHAYPLCNIPAHHPDSTPNIHEVATATAIAHAILNSEAPQVPSPPASTPNVPSLSVLAPVHVDNNPIHVPLFDNMSTSAPLYHAHQTVTKSVHDSTPSPDPAATAPDNSSARTMPPTSCETSTSTSSVPPPAAVSLQNTADLLVHSEILSSASPELVLDDITGPSLNQSSSLPESHCTILTKISPGAPSWPSSAPDLDTVEGSTRAGSRGDREALHPDLANSAIQANTVAILDHPPPPPPTPALPLASEIAVDTPSQGESDAENMGDPSPYALHGQYDVA